MYRNFPVQQSLKHQFVKMSRIGGWLKGFSGAPVSNGRKSSSREEEVEDMQDAMIATSLIMNDDVEGANRQLMLKDSPFHLLGRGL